MLLWRADGLPPCAHDMPINRHLFGVFIVLALSLLNADRGVELGRWLVGFGRGEFGSFSARRLRAWTAAG
jgi:hypothetical protein